MTIELNVKVTKASVSVGSIKPSNIVAKMYVHITPHPPPNIEKQTLELISRKGMYFDLINSIVLMISAPIFNPISGLKLRNEFIYTPDSTRKMYIIKNKLEALV